MTQPTYPNQQNKTTDKKEPQDVIREDKKTKKDEMDTKHTHGFHKSQNQPSGQKNKSGRDLENDEDQQKPGDTKYRR